MTSAEDEPKQNSPGREITVTGSRTGNWMYIRITPYQLWNTRPVEAVKGHRSRSSKTQSLLSIQFTFLQHLPTYFIGLLLKSVLKRCKALPWNIHSSMGSKANLLYYWTGINQIFSLPRFNWEWGCRTAKRSESQRSGSQWKKPIGFICHRIPWGFVANTWHSLSWGRIQDLSTYKDAGKEI